MTKGVTTWRSQPNLHLAKNHYKQHIKRMGDSDNASPANGEQPNRMQDQMSSNRPPLNETSMRTGEWTCTQKLSITSLEKYDSSSANLWWRKFIQYVEVTNDIDISPMVNSKRILPQHREQLEAEIKDIINGQLDKTHSPKLPRR